MKQNYFLNEEVVKVSIFLVLGMANVNERARMKKLLFSFDFFHSLICSLINSTHLNYTFPNTETLVVVKTAY